MLRLQFLESENLTILKELLPQLGELFEWLSAGCVAISPLVVTDRINHRLGVILEHRAHAFQERIGTGGGSRLDVADMDQKRKILLLGLFQELLQLDVLFGRIRRITNREKSKSRLAVTSQISHEAGANCQNAEQLRDIHSNILGIALRQCNKASLHKKIWLLIQPHIRANRFSPGFITCRSCSQRAQVGQKVGCLLGCHVAEQELWHE